MAKINPRGMSQGDLVRLLDRATGTLWIPAGHFNLQPTSTEVLVGGTIPTAISYDTSSDESACANIYIPDDIDCGEAMSAYIYYSCVSTSGTVCFDIDYVSRASGEDVGVAVTDVEGTATTTNGTADVLEISSAYSIVADACANGDVLFMNVRRDVSADNASGDADMYGVRIDYTTRPSIKE